MNFFIKVLEFTKGRINTFFDTMKFGITGTKYGALPRTEAVDIERATQTSIVPRFASYDNNPSYIRLYSDTYRYKHPEEYAPEKYAPDDDSEEDDPEEDDPEEDDPEEDYTKKKTLKYSHRPEKDDIEEHDIKEETLKHKNAAVEKDYLKDLDSTQAAFIVIKQNANTYIVHLLFTRETRIHFLKGKIPTILLRVLYLEQFKFGQNIPESYICVGTLDANNNRDQNQISFHQDNFPTYFISNPFETLFNNFIFNLFRGTPHYPQCGFLDFQTLINMVATTTGRDRTNELFSFLRGAKGRFAPFFAYLNSIITHATPDLLKMDEIESYYRSQGLDVPLEVREFVEKYNIYLTILRENERKFRRCLLSFADFSRANEKKANDTIQEFKNNATVTIEEDIIKKNLKKQNLVESSIYDPQIEEKKLFKNNQFSNDHVRINVDKFVYMKKTFVKGVSIIEVPPNLNYLIQLKDEMFEPTDTSRLLVARDTGMATLVPSTAGGKRKSKRNKSKRIRNTKKKYYFKKRRSSQKKNNNKKRKSKKS